MSMLDSHEFTSSRVYDVVMLHRRPELEQGLKDLGVMAGERLAVAESAWRIRLDRARQIDFLFVESDGAILHAAKVLGAEMVTQRDIDDGHPEVKGRVRFITSHHLPEFVDRLIGSEIPRHRNPVRYARLVHDLTDDIGILDPVD
jgi:hypothetical protein